MCTFSIIKKLKFELLDRSFTFAHSFGYYILTLKMQTSQICEQQEFTPECISLCDICGQQEKTHEYVAQRCKGCRSRRLSLADCEFLPISCSSCSSCRWNLIGIRNICDKCCKNKIDGKDNMAYIKHAEPNHDLNIFCAPIQDNSHDLKHDPTLTGFCRICNLNIEPKTFIDSLCHKHEKEIQFHTQFTEICPFCLKGGHDDDSTCDVDFCAKMTCTTYVRGGEFCSQHIPMSPMVEPIN